MCKAKRYIALLLLVVTVLSIAVIPISAANVCMKNGYFVGYSDDKKGSVFYVHTGKGSLLGLVRPYITLKQCAGTYSRTHGTDKSSYGYFKIKIENLNKSSDRKTVDWKCTKEYKMYLSRNTRYRITITPSNFDIMWKYPSFLRWQRAAWWEVKKTSSISSCSNF